MISHPEELSLLAAVLVKTGGTADLVALLQGESLKSVTEQDRPHADTLLLLAIESDPASADNEKVISQMLQGEDGASQDDRVWSLLVKFATTPESRQERIEQIDAVLSKQPQHRQALLAKIDLLASSTRTDKSLLPKLLDTCQEYYKSFGSKTFCFDDLIQRLRIAGAEAVKSFQRGNEDEPPSSGPTVRDLFLLKLEYHILSTSDCPSGHLSNFASRALGLYSTAEDNESVAAEAALLGALALLRVAHGSEDPAFLLQTNMVLRTACSKFKDYYPLRILLIQLQMASGQIHLAMQDFAHLSVKNLQWETVGHLLLTRISTLHPHQHGRGEDSLNPSGALDTALHVSRNSQRSIDRAISDGLKQGSYSNIIGTAEVKNNLQLSLNRQLFMMEQCKIQRALGLAAVYPFDPVEGELRDLRDMSFMPTYGVDDQDFAQMLQCGPQPSQGWLNAMTMHEGLLTYLMSELGTVNSGAPDGVVELALQNLEKKVLRVSVGAADMTPDEKQAACVYRTLAKIVLDLAKKKDNSPQDLDKIAEAVEKPGRAVNAVSVNGVDYPDAKWLHHRFVRFEMLQTVAHFTAIMAKKLKGGKSKKADGMDRFIKSLEELRSMVNKQAEASHAEARDLKQSLNAAGVLGKLVDVVLGRTDGTQEGYEKLSERIVALQGEAAVEEYCGAMRESWEDALDGVLAVKIKTI